MLSKESHGSKPQTMSNAAPLMAFTTCPDASTAEGIAAQLVEARLAACVTIVPGATSIYQWQGAIEKESEMLLLIKTTGERWDALCETLAAAHPYEVPELVATPLTQVSAPYLEWLRQAVEENPPCNG